MANWQSMMCISWTDNKGDNPCWHRSGLVAPLTETKKTLFFINSVTKKERFFKISLKHFGTCLIYWLYVCYETVYVDMSCNLRGKISFNDMPVNSLSSCLTLSNMYLYWYVKVAIFLPVN